MTHLDYAAAVTFINVSDTMQNVIGGVLIVAIVGFWNWLRQNRKEDQKERAARDLKRKQEREQDELFRKEMNIRVTRLEHSLLGDRGDKEMGIPPAKGLIAVVKGIDDTLQEVKKNLLPNGGSSLSDKMDRLLQQDE